MAFSKREERSLLDSFHMKSLPFKPFKIQITHSQPFEVKLNRSLPFSSSWRIHFIFFFNCKIEWKLTIIPHKKNQMTKKLGNGILLPPSFPYVHILTYLVQFVQCMLRQFKKCLQIDILHSMCVIWYVCELWHVNCLLPAYGINQLGVNNSLLFHLFLRFPLLYFLLPSLHYFFGDLVMW